MRTATGSAPRSFHPTVPPTVTESLVDPSGPLSHVVAETDASDALAAYYVRGDDLLAVLRSTGDRFYHTDGLGSVRALSDEAGQVTDRYTFTAFGELWAHQGNDPNAYLFAGEPLDPNSGFYYLRARWMDPATGRFASVDAFEGVLFEPASLHKYLYVASRPVDLTDPSGNSWISEAVVSLAIRSTLFTMNHPRLMFAIGFVANVFVPEEFSNALITSSNPYGQAWGYTARAEARFFRLIKSRLFRSFVKKSRSEAGRLWKHHGEEFENFLSRYLLKGAQRQYKILGTGNSVDFILKGVMIEAKTSSKLGPGEMRQLRAIAAHAKSSGFGFSYLFLKKPSNGTVDKIKNLGGKVFWLYED